MHSQIVQVFTLALLFAAITSCSMPLTPCSSAKTIDTRATEVAEPTPPASTEKWMTTHSAKHALHSVKHTINLEPPNNISQPTGDKKKPTLTYTNVTSINQSAPLKAKPFANPKSKDNKLMDFNTFLSDILATIIGGGVLTALFFFAREKLFPLPDITGQWYLEQATEITAYNPYKGMVLRYTLMLLREGNRITGTAELIYENSSTGERPYIGKHRRRAIIDGYIEKNYFSNDKVFLHVVEDGHGRTSTHFYNFEPHRKGVLIGTFSSMVADSNGRAKCQRQCF